MEQYISKSALVEEIERNLHICAIMFSQHQNENCVELYKQKAEVYQGMRSFLDTLEAKEVDVEEKATQLSQKYFPNEENIWARSNIEARKCKSACIEMVEWLKAQKGEEL